MHDLISPKQLKKDLEEVITVTESLILKKQEKAFDPAKTQKPNNKQNKNHNQYYHSYDNQNNQYHDSHSNANNSNTNIYANNPMFIQNNQFKNEKHKKPIPREWGINKDHYEIGERCQVF